MHVLCFNKKIPHGLPNYENPLFLPTGILIYSRNSPCYLKICFRSSAMLDSIHQQISSIYKVIIREEKTFKKIGTCTYIWLLTVCFFRLSSIGENGASWTL